MGIRLIVEVLDSAPSVLSQSERLLLVVLAERADDVTRRVQWRRSEAPMDVLTRRTGLSPRGVRDVVTRLSHHGLDVRVPIGTDRRGRPLYAVPGRSLDYRVPALDLGSIGDVVVPPIGDVVVPPIGDVVVPPIGDVVVPPGGTRVPPGGTTTSPHALSPFSTTTMGAPGAESSPAAVLGGVVVDGLPRAIQGQIDRVTVERTCRRLVDLGWTAETLGAAVRARSWAGAGPGLVIEWLRTRRAPGSDRGATPTRRPWCGVCVEATRFDESDPDHPRRCQRCAGAA